MKDTMRRPSLFLRYVSVLLLLTTWVVTPSSASDWPEWRGKGRLGFWSEDGILQRFPPSGLKVKWRAPLSGGYAGPAVAQGRVFVLDYLAKTGRKGAERVMALDENSGRRLWTRSWKTDYTGLSGSYAIGPRATPTVDNSRVYILGAKGALLCLRSDSGEILWQKDFVRDYGTEVPVWGMVGAPLVDGPRLIALVGGQDGAKVVAFDKQSGRELWRALPSDSEPGYAPPILITAGGHRQLIIWHPKAVSALNPRTGEILWQQPFRVDKGLSVATPVFSNSRLLVSAFVNGSMMLELDRQYPVARLLWQGGSDSEIETDTLHSLISTPVIDGETLYGVGSYGHLRGLNATTGERLWETLAVTGEKARWATAFLVRHQNRYFISNDRGELIIAKLAPSGYREIDRTRLIAPTSHMGIGRRQAGAVNWSHPAYANRHIFARNDGEILCASLARTGRMTEQPLR